MVERFGFQILSHIRKVMIVGLNFIFNRPAVFSVLGLMKMKVIVREL
ncbi:MAG: hypothetical protein JW943_02350 [Deltaproteobacteria bacterium]|nr:hypothetical protein [Deltaproteobacteria bacterium]